jgi:cobalt-zinc-cadmium efflux system protein
MGVEVVMGVLSGSLGLLADAGHMASDAASLAIALVAQRIALRPRSHERTYGSRRAEVIAAFVNGVALVVTALLIVREAIERVMQPPSILGGWMLATAVAGFVVNLLAAWVLGDGGHDNPNTRAAFVHVLADALGSVGAVAAAVVVLAFGWYLADPIISLVIAVLILWSAWQLVRETTSVLMEGAPTHLDVHDLEATIREMRGVCGVHDLHAWTISEGFHVLTAHIVVVDGASPAAVVREVAAMIRDRHGIEHVTLQTESPDFHPCRMGCQGSCARQTQEEP